MEELRQGEFESLFENLNKGIMPKNPEQYTPWSELKALDKTGLLKKSEDIFRNADSKTSYLLFNVLQRGQWSSASAFDHLVNGEFDQILPDIYGALGGDQPQVSSYIDVTRKAAKKLGWDLPDWVTGPIGFAEDIALDPTTYIPTTGPGKLIGMMRLDKAADALSKWGPISRNFVYRGALQEIPGAADEFKRFDLAKVFAQRQILEELEEDVKAVREVAAEIGKEKPWLADPDNLLRRVRYYFERKKEWMLEPAEKGIAKRIDDKLDAQFMRDLEAGFVEWDDFFLNATPKVIKGKETGKLTMDFVNPFLINDPKIGRLPTEHVNEYLESIWKKGRSSEPTEVLDNILEATAIRRFVSEQAISRRELAQRILTPVEQGGYAIRIDNIDWNSLGKGEIRIPKGMKLILHSNDLSSPATKSLEQKLLRESLEEVPDKKLGELLMGRSGSAMRDVVTLKQSDVELIKGGKSAIPLYLVPTEVHDEFKKTTQLFASEKDLKWFYKTYHWAMNFWKSQATGLRPAFHMRNAIGSLEQMYRAGVPGPELLRYSAKGAQILRKQGEFAGFSAEELLSLSAKYGARGHGWLAADMPSNFLREAERGAKLKKWYEEGVPGKPWEVVTKPLSGLNRKAQKMGMHIEDTFRLGTWLHALSEAGVQKGMDPVELDHAMTTAAARVRKYHFDYDELTPFEQKVGKNLFPFYTFMKKNTVNQLESLILQPRKYQRLAKFEEGLWHSFFEGGETPEENKLKPAYFNEMRYRPTSWTDDKGNRIYYHIDLPWKQLRLLEKPKEFLHSLNPVKGLADLLMNMTTFPEPRQLRKDIERVPAPFWVSWLGKDGKEQRTWGRWLDLAPMMDQRTGKMIMGMNPQWLAGIQHIFPFLKEWGDMFPEAGSLAAESAKGKWQAINYTTGLRFTPLDLEKEKKRMAAQTLKVKTERAPGLMKNRGGALSEEDIAELKKIYGLPSD